jgi:hypothetical protein
MINIEPSDLQEVITRLQSLADRIREERSEIEIVGRDDQLNYDELGQEYHEVIVLKERLTEKAPTFVTVYNVSQEYGGPEEGDWYYDWYSSPCVLATFREEDEARHAARLLNAEERRLRKENGERDRYSVLGGTDRVYVAEQELGSRIKKERPRYE